MNDLKKKMTNPLDAWIERIRSTDPMTFEDAYFEERPKGPEVVDRLVLELRAAADSFTRGKFCELLGEMGDASTIPILTDELAHPDERVREWAKLAIDELKAGPTARASGEKYRSQFVKESDKRQ